MGLRDRYLSALVARCVVAVHMECNTQQPPVLLRVAPPRETQHATTDPALAAPATVAPLHATEHATATQHAQQADYGAQVERSAIVSANGAAYWDADDLAGFPAWTDAEIAVFEKRVVRSIWLGYPDADARAERLLRRDRDLDDGRLCVECEHARPGWRCARREAFFLDRMQRCPMFKEKPL